MFQASFVVSERERDILIWLVRQCHALAYRRYSKRYVQDEAQAKAEGRGMRAGENVAPWAWRRGKCLQ